MGPKRDTLKAFKAGECVELANAVMRIGVHVATGEVVSLFSKRTRREHLLLRPMSGDAPRPMAHWLCRPRHRASYDAGPSFMLGSYDPTIGIRRALLAAGSFMLGSYDPTICPSGSPTPGRKGPQNH